MWQSQEPASINQTDAVERPAERITTLLQEIYDLLEKEAEHKNESYSFKKDMGRWRKLAIRNYIQHPTADRLTAASHLRDDLQHIYPEIKKLSGSDIYEIASGMPDLLAQAVTGLKNWQTALGIK